MYQRARAARAASRRASTWTRARTRAAGRRSRRSPTRPAASDARAPSRSSSSTSTCAARRRPTGRRSSSTSRRANQYVSAGRPLAAGGHDVRAPRARRGQPASADERTAAPRRRGAQSYVTNPAAGFSMAFNQYGTVAATPYVPTDQRLEGPQGLTFRTPVADQPADARRPDRAAPRRRVDGDRHRLAREARRRRARRQRVDHHRGRAARLAPRARPRAEHARAARTTRTPTRSRSSPNRFYEYDVEIWPTAYELAPGHRLQLRLTSTDLPTHLPGSIHFDRDRPQDARIDLLPPATNTVRFDGSHLVAAGREARRRANRSAAGRYPSAG